MTIYSLKFIILMDHPILLQFIPQQFTNYLNFWFTILNVPHIFIIR